MKKVVCFSVLVMIMVLSCGFSLKSQVKDSVVGVWKEYRVDPNDDYGLSYWKFNEDGSGIFMVEGYEIITKKVFLWERNDRYTILVEFEGDIMYLKQRNGMLEEDSDVFGVIKYKKIAQK